MVHSGNWTEVAAEFGCGVVALVVGRRHRVVVVVVQSCWLGIQDTLAGNVASVASVEGAGGVASAGDAGGAAGVAGVAGVVRVVVGILVVVQGADVDGVDGVDVAAHHFQDCSRHPTLS